MCFNCDVLWLEMCTYLRFKFIFKSILFAYIYPDNTIQDDHFIISNMIIFIWRFPVNFVLVFLQSLYFVFWGWWVISFFKTIPSNKFVTYYLNVWIVIPNWLFDLLSLRPFLHSVPNSFPIKSYSIAVLII